MIACGVLYCGLCTAQVHDHCQRVIRAQRSLAPGRPQCTGAQGGPGVLLHLAEVGVCAGDYYIAEKYHQQYLAKGGRFGMPQSAEKGATENIRCYG